MYNKELGSFPYCNSDTINLDYIIKTVLEYTKKFKLLKDDFDRLEEKLADMMKLLEPTVRTVLEDMYADGRLEQLIAKYLGWSANLEMFGGGTGKLASENDTAMKAFLLSDDFDTLILRDYDYNISHIVRDSVNKPKTILGGRGSLIFNNGGVIETINDVSYEFNNKYPVTFRDVRFVINNGILNIKLKCGIFNKCIFELDENSRIETNPVITSDTDYSSDLLMSDILINVLGEGSDVEPVLTINTHDGNFRDFKYYGWRPFCKVSQHNYLSDFHPVFRSARYHGDISKVYGICIDANNVYLINYYSDNFPIGIYVNGTKRWKVDNFTCLWYAEENYTHYGVYVSDSASAYHGIINGGDYQYLHDNGDVVGIRLPESCYYSDYENHISNYHVEKDTTPRLPLNDPIFLRRNIDIIGNSSDNKTYIGCTYHTSKATYNLKVFTTIAGLDLMVRGSTIESARNMYGNGHSLKISNVNIGNFTYWFVSNINETAWGTTTYIHVETDCKWFMYNPSNKNYPTGETHSASIDTYGKIKIDGVEFAGNEVGVDLNVTDISELPVGFIGRIILTQTIDSTSINSLAGGVFVSGKPTRKVFYFLGTNLQYLIQETSSGLTCKRIFN